jgi:hypothetical protein
MILELLHKACKSIYQQYWIKSSINYRKLVYALCSAKQLIAHG